MSTDTFSDLEARLRDDLPRLADELLSVDSDRPALGDARTLEPAGAPRGSRRWLVPVAAIAAAVLVLVGVVVAVRAGDHRGVGPVDVGPAPVEAGWAPMATSPLSPREAAVSVWTGTEVIIWGGRVGNMALLDGAAYNPATDTWRTITPNSWGHPGAHAVWTGTEMVVLAKNGGAAYDPATDTWRDLPRLDDGSGSFLAPVWTGDQLLGTGVQEVDGELQIAVWSLASDGGSWHLEGVSSSPGGVPDTQYLTAVWTGQQAVVWNGLAQGWGFTPDSGAVANLPVLTPLGSGHLTDSIAVVVDGGLAALTTEQGVLRTDDRWTAGYGPSAPTAGWSCPHTISPKPAVRRWRWSWAKRSSSCPPTARRSR